MSKKEDKKKIWIGAGAVGLVVVAIAAVSSGGGILY